MRILKWIVFFAAIQPSTESATTRSVQTTEAGTTLEIATVAPSDPTDAGTTLEDTTIIVTTSVTNPLVTEPTDPVTTHAQSTTAFAGTTLESAIGEIRIDESRALVTHVYEVQTNKNLRRIYLYYYSNINLI